MELELVYDRKHLTKRMDRMKEALSTGQIVNHKRLQHAMGSELDYRKKKHDEMLQQQLKRLEEFKSQLALRAQTRTLIH